MSYLPCCCKVLYGSEPLNLYLHPKDIMCNNWNLPLLINCQKCNTCTLGFVIAAWLHPINCGLSLWECENGQLPSEAGSECQCKNQGKYILIFLLSNQTHLAKGTIRTLDNSRKLLFDLSFILLFSSRSHFKEAV